MAKSETQISAPGAPQLDFNGYMATTSCGEPDTSTLHWGQSLHKHPHMFPFHTRGEL